MRFFRRSVWCLLIAFAGAAPIAAQEVDTVAALKTAFEHEFSESPESMFVEAGVVQPETPADSALSRPLTDALAEAVGRRGAHYEDIRQCEPPTVPDPRRKCELQGTDVLVQVLLRHIDDTTAVVRVQRRTAHTGGLGGVSGRELLLTIEDGFWQVVEVLSVFATE